MARLVNLLLALSVGVMAPLAAAQIVIGQTSGFTGPVAPGVKEITDGARLYIDHVNARGGIAGQSVRLVSLDDRFDPAAARENARTLIAEHRAVALFLNRGTPHTQAILPLLTEYGVSLVAPSTGAMLLHKPVHPWVFNVRATYQREAESAVMHLATIGVVRVGVAHVDDSFGDDCATGARRGFDKAELQPSFVVKFNREKPDLRPVVEAMSRSNAQAVLLIGSATAVAEGTRLLRTSGSRAQVITMSNNASGGFIKLLGEHAHGVIVAQVFPNERHLGIPMVREAVALAKSRGWEGVTPAMLEGFAAAKVLVEALRRAAPNITRDRVRAALEGLSMNVGGYDVRYGPDDHTGLEFVELSIIGADGKFRR